MVNAKGQGRKRKPTATKIAEGNPGKRELSPEKEPQFKKEIPKCPTFLSKEAKAEWKFLTKHLFEAGLLTVIDGVELSMLCQAFGRWAQIEKKISKLKSIQYSDQNYLPKIHPLIKAANTEMMTVHRLLVSFGMTPSSRAGLHVGKIGETDDELWKRFVEMRSKKGGKKAKK